MGTELNTPDHHTCVHLHHEVDIIWCHKDWKYDGWPGRYRSPRVWVRGLEKDVGDILRNANHVRPRFWGWVHRYLHPARNVSYNGRGAPPGPRDLPNKQYGVNVHGLRNRVIHSSKLVPAARV